MKKNIFIIPLIIALIAFLLSSVIVAHLFLLGIHNDVVVLIMRVLPFHVFTSMALLLALIPEMKRQGICAVLDIFPVFPNIKSTLKMLLLVYILILAFNYVGTQICKLCGIPVVEQSLAQIPSGAGCGYIAVLIFSTVVLAPVAEEITMRLALHDCISHYWAVGAQYIVAAVFAVMHLCPQYTISLMILSLVLQKMRREGGLAQAMLLHALYNAVSVTTIIVFHFFMAHITE